jgi:hypothetical protein
VQRIIFCRIEVEELGNILPLTDIAQLKMVMRTIQFLKPELAQLMPAQLVTVLSFTHAAGCPQSQPCPWTHDNLAHRMSTIIAFHFKTFPAAE